MMKRWLIPLLAAVIAAVTLVAKTTAAGPAGTSVQITKTATLVTPTTIVVPVVLVCPAGQVGGVSVSVSEPQPTGPNTNGFGFANRLCDGTRQTVNVSVNGGPFWLV